METRTVSVSQDWLEAGTVSEIMEALHNWTAVRFMVAPWDWSGLLIARVIHEAGFFVMVTESEAQQRALLEKFVDEALAVNKRNCIQGDPPMVYREMVVLASDVTRNDSGRQSDLWRKMDVYGAFCTVKQKEAELDAKLA